MNRSAVLGISSLLLGKDEGDAGAVRVNGWSPLPSAAVEHGQGGQRRGGTAVPSHDPQLIRVPVDGVVMVQLDPAAEERQRLNHAKTSCYFDCCLFISQFK